MDVAALPTVLFLHFFPQVPPAESPFPSAAYLLEKLSHGIFRPLVDDLNEDYFPNNIRRGRETRLLI
jgi:hypothetical protein